jgi:ABC-type antimicrobial peptide transport system permease subunit
MILRECLWLVGLGIVVGTAAAAGTARIVQAMLFGVTATDPVTYLVVGLLLCGTALLASMAPARRASRVDPMVALAAE